MEILVKIQQTALLTMVICLLIVWSDKREPAQVPPRKMVAVIVPFVISALSLVVATYCRIWC